ncbi:MAG: CBS domain-containing protein [Candidatus Rokubacteria bacterium]|nr:CBS domain-containing protein [Candidatus Rokubacteria bacterium]
MSTRARRPRAPGAHAPAVWIAPVPVQRWMRQPVVTIGAGTSVRDAAALMRERGIRHLPVLDAGQRLVGIVTDRDLRQVIFDVAMGRAGEDVEGLGDLEVREVMTWGVVTVTPATDLGAAASVMRERRLGALPVVDEAAHVVGILTERDLLDALQAVLRERVVRPSPTAAEPGGTYDPGLEPPPDADAWRNGVALDWLAVGGSGGAPPDAPRVTREVQGMIGARARPAPDRGCACEAAAGRAREERG